MHQTKTLNVSRRIRSILILTLLASLFAGMLETAIAQVSKAQNDELFSYVRILDPGAGKEIDALRDELRRTGSASAKARIRTVLAWTAAKHAGKASDDASIKAAMIVFSSLEKLSDRPELCYRFLHPRPGQWTDWSAILGVSAGLEDHEASMRLLKEAALTPQKPPRDEELKPIWEEIGKKLNPKYDDRQMDIIADARNHPDEAEAKLVCAGSLDLYRVIFSLPKQHQGLVLRSMFSGN